MCADYYRYSYLQALKEGFVGPTTPFTRIINNPDSNSELTISLPNASPFVINYPFGNLTMIVGPFFSLIKEIGVKLNKTLAIKNDYAKEPPVRPSDINMFPTSPSNPTSFELMFGLNSGQSAWRPSRAIDVIRQGHIMHKVFIADDSHFDFMILDPSCVGLFLAAFFTSILLNCFLMDGSKVYRLNGSLKFFLVSIISTPVVRPKSLLLGAFWLLGCQLFNEFFGGEIFTSIAKTPGLDLIDSWEDLCREIKSGRKPNVTTVTANIGSYFGTATECAKELESVLQRYVMNGQPVKVINKKTGFYYLEASRGTVALLLPEPFLVTAAARINRLCEVGVDCVHVSRQGGMVAPYFIAIKRYVDSKSVDIASTIISRLQESGLFSLWMAFALNDYHYYTHELSELSTISEDYSQLQVSQLDDTFYLALVGHILSIITILFYECLYKSQFVKEKPKVRTRRPLEESWFYRILREQTNI